MRRSYQPHRASCRSSWSSAAVTARTAQSGRPRQPRRFECCRYDLWTCCPPSRGVSPLVGRRELPYQIKPKLRQAFPEGGHGRCHRNRADQRPGNVMEAHRERALGKLRVWGSAGTTSTVEMAGELVSRSRAPVNTQVEFSWFSNFFTDELTLARDTSSRSVTLGRPVQPAPYLSPKLE